MKSILEKSGRGVCCVLSFVNGKRLLEEALWRSRYLKIPLYSEQITIFCALVSASILTTIFSGRNHHYQILYIVTKRKEYLRTIGHLVRLRSNWRQTTPRCGCVLVTVYLLQR